MEMMVAGQDDGKEGGEGNVSAEMKVASQDDKFLGDKVACTEFHDDEREGNVGTKEIFASQVIQLIKFNDDETKRNIGAPKILFSKVDNSASALLDVRTLRACDVDTVCPKGTQTIKTDLNLPHEWVFSDPLGIWEPVFVPKDDDEEGGDEVEGGTLVASPIIPTKVDKSPVQHIAEKVNNEIGLVFQEKGGKETTVWLRDLGSYVKFNSQECYHKGFKHGNFKTYHSAQLFSAPSGNR
jgi:hypothetical protein